jgi:hypothetical protein
MALRKKKNQQEVTSTAFDLENFDPDAEVSLSLSAGELTIIHYTLRKTLEELEVLYKAGDRSNETQLSGGFATSVVEKVEEVLRPVAEWAHNQVEQHDHQH